MRNRIIYLTMMFALFLGCSKGSGTGDPEEPGDGGKEVSLTLSPSELTFSQSGEEKVFSITTAADWTVASGSSWCRVNATGGSGNGSVTVKTDPNEGYSDRTANITVRAGGTTKVLTVTQKKKNALLLTKEKFDVSFEGDTVSVEVKSNVTYTATIPTACSSWIRQVTLSKVLETKTLHFAISPNTADTKREGMIIFKESGGTLCDTVRIYQAEKGELVLTKDTCLVSSDGATVEVELRTNTDYEVTIPSEAKDWLTLLEGKATRVDKIMMEVKPNTAHDAREARVTVKDKNSTLTDTLYIRQAQLNAIVLTQKRYEVPAAGQGIAVEVKSNVDFETEITPASAKDWVILNPGSKALVTHALNYTVQPNATYDSREARIIIRDKANQLTDTVTIFQQQKDALILNKHDYTVPAVGDTIAVEVQSNIDYEVTVSDSAKAWISPLLQSKALIKNTLYFVIQPNPDYMERAGEILIKDKNSTLTDTLYIRQAQLNAIELTQKRYEVPTSGQSISIEVKSNVDFEAEVMPEEARTWVVVAPAAKAMVTSTLNYKVLPNTTHDLRKARIIIRDKANQVADTVMIFQQQKDALILSEHDYTVPAVGDTLSVEVQSNVEYEVMVSDSAKAWISPLLQSKALTTSMLHFVVQRNLDYSKRTGEIAIKDKSGTLTDTVRVMQEAKKETYFGDITFRTTKDLTGFMLMGYTKVKGNVTVSGDELKTLLQLGHSLLEIDGNITFDCPTLTSFIGLNRLKTVTGSVRIISGSMTSFNGLNNLETIGDSLVIKDGRFASFNGLGKLQRIGGDFEVNASSSDYYGYSYLGALASFDGLESLESVGGSFKVIASNSLKSVTSFNGLGKLKSIGGDFEVNASYSSLNALTSFDGLESLESVGGSFKVIASSSLKSVTSFNGLGKLQRIGGDFEVNASYHSLNKLASFDGLESLEYVGGNFKLIASCIDLIITTPSSLNSLSSFKGLSKLQRIGGDFEVNASSDIRSSSLNNLASFEGLESLENVGDNFKLIASSWNTSSSLKSLSSFDGLSKLQRIGGDFEVNASSALRLSSSLDNLSSFEGLESLESVGGSFKVIASSSLNSVTSFNSLGKLKSIGGDFELNASYSSLNNLASFEGLESLESVGGNFKVIASSSSLESLNSFKGLSDLKNIGGDFEVNASSLDSFSSYSSLSNLASFEGLESLENIGCSFKVIASSSLNSLTSFKGLSKLKNIGGDFEVNAFFPTSSTSSLSNLVSFEGLESLESVGGSFKVIPSFSSPLYFEAFTSLTSFKGLSKLRSIGKDFKINRCYALTSMEDLKNLEKIGGCFNLDRLDKLTTLNGLEKLTGITEGLTINACRRLNNVAALSNLNTVKKITITYCPYLNDFSSLKSVLQRTGCDLYTEYNGANPTKEELLNKSNEGTNN